VPEKKRCRFAITIRQKQVRCCNMLHSVFMVLVNAICGASKCPLINDFSSFFSPAVKEAAEIYSKGR
jgi:hypothetical protein